MRSTSRVMDRGEKGLKNKGCAIWKNWSYCLENDGCGQETNRIDEKTIGILFREQYAYCLENN